MASFPAAILHDNRESFKWEITLKLGYLDDVLEPFYEKKQVCQRLISYLNQLQASAERDTCISKELLAEVHEVAAQIVQPHVPHQFSFDSEDSAEDFPPGFQQLSIREPVVDPVVKNSTKRRFNGKKNLKKQNMVIFFV